MLSDGIKEEDDSTSALLYLNKYNKNATKTLLKEVNVTPT